MTTLTAVLALYLLTWSPLVAQEECLGKIRFQAMNGAKFDHKTTHKWINDDWGQVKIGFDTDFQESEIAAGALWVRGTVKTTLNLSISWRAINGASRTWSVAVGAGDGYQDVAREIVSSSPTGISLQTVKYLDGELVFAGNGEYLAASGQRGSPLFVARKVVDLSDQVDLVEGALLNEILGDGLDSTIEAFVTPAKPLACELDSRGSYHTREVAALAGYYEVASENLASWVNVIVLWSGRLPSSPAPNSINNHIPGHEISHPLFDGGPRVHVGYPTNLLYAYPDRDSGYLGQKQGDAARNISKDRLLHCESVHRPTKLSSLSGRKTAWGDLRSPALEEDSLVVAEGQELADAMLAELEELFRDGDRTAAIALIKEKALLSLNPMADGTTLCDVWAGGVHDLRLAAALWRLISPAGHHESVLKELSAAQEAHLRAIESLESLDAMLCDFRNQLSPGLVQLAQPGRTVDCRINVLPIVEGAGRGLGPPRAALGADPLY